MARIEIGEKIVKQLTGAKQVRVRDMNGTAKIEVSVDELSLLENNLVLQKIKEQLKLISFEDVSIDPEGYRPEKIIKQLTGAKQVRVRDMDGIAKIEVGVDELSLLENNLVLQKIKNQLKLISFDDVLIDPEGYRPGKINVITN